MRRYQSNGGNPYEGEQPLPQEEVGSAPTERLFLDDENDLPPLPPRPGYQRPHPIAYERPAPAPLPQPAPEEYETSSETAPRLPRSRIIFSIAKCNQFLHWLLSVIEVMFALRFVLSFLATQAGNPFIQVLTSITDPLLAPFKTALDVRGTGIQWYILLGMLVYFLVILALIRFLRLFVTEPEL